MRADEPNVTLALAVSYNERGIAGFTNTVTSGLDQRKINSIYEPIKNAMSGETTLYLAKRPGVDVNSGNPLGTSGQIAYLIINGANLFGASQGNMWLFNVNGTDVRVSSNVATQIIATAANTYPIYVDRMAISGTDTLVVQIVNSTTGAQTAWYSNAIATWTQIVDTDFTGLTLNGKMEYMDGYAFALDGAMKSINNSDLNSIANWTAGNYITKQIVQDAAYGLMRLGKKIVAFGAETAEVFINNGNPTGSPLITIPDSASRIGINPQTISTSVFGQTNYYAILGNKSYFVGRSSGQNGFGLFVFDGSQFNKVSSVAVDKILTQLGQPYSVNKILFSGQEAIAIALDPTTATTQRWLMYFPQWNDWFEWNSTTFTPVGTGIWNLGVGTNQHKIYKLSTGTENWQDDSTNYTMSHQFQLPTKGNQRNFMRFYGLKADTARSAQTVTVEFSDDDYQTFSTYGTIDMTSAMKANFTGGSYQGARVVRLSGTGNAQYRMEKFLSRIE